MPTQEADEDEDVDGNYQLQTSEVPHHNLTLARNILYRVRTVETVIGACWRACCVG